MEIKIEELQVLFERLYYGNIEGAQHQLTEILENNGHIFDESNRTWIKTI